MELNNFKENDGDNMKLIELFAPLYDNEGNTFEQGIFEGLRKEFTDKFGGVTIYKRTTGYWKQPGEATQKDQILIYEIQAPEIDKVYWNALKERLLWALHQDQLLLRCSDVELL